MTGINKYFKPSVIALEPYSSARDEYVGSEGIFLDANENGHAFDYNRYPDPYQKALKQEIGRWRKLEPKSIFLGNGSDEIIDLLIRTTCQTGKDRILSLDPSYGMYRVSSSINEISLDLVDMNADFTVDQNRLFATLNDSHKLIFICSPNNPNGGIIDQDIIEEILNRSNGLVVIDEAYIDFSRSKSWIARLKEYENLIILQTFSKSLGAAGIRLGMAFMKAELVTFFNKVKPPYNISTPNQEAALSRLGNLDIIGKSVQSLIAQREWVRQLLNELAIVENVFPSEANFLLVRFRDTSTVFEELKSQKIIVRDRSSQKNCEGCLRISIGTKAENEKLISALVKIEAELTVEL